MHEWSITEKVVAEVMSNAERNNLKRVNKVFLSVGKDIDFLDSIKFWFKELSKETIAKGAKLKIKKSKQPGITIDSIEGETQDKKWREY